MVKIGIIGASGYSGLELVNILLNHPETDIEFITGTERVAGKFMSELYPVLRDRTSLKFELTDVDKIINSDVDCLFLATPNETSLEIVPRIIMESNKKVIDLSGAFRLKDSSLYPAFYGFENNNALMLKDAVYGIPELNASQIAESRLIANPGCYPTSIIIPLYPLFASNLLKVSQKIVIDSKSGVTGAGRKPTDTTHYVETNESLKAYKLHSHRHEPEIKQELSNAASYELNISFTPHLVPINRGILSTIYADLNDNVLSGDVLSVWQKFYAGSKFVRVLVEGFLPEIKFVSYTPYCDIGFSIRDNEIIIVSCIDNLLKGASSQAIQNYNLMFGFKEELGL